MDKQTKAFLCSVANRYMGGGPFVDKTNFQFVKPYFLKKWVQKAIKSKKLTKKGIQVAEAWLAKNDHVSE